MVRSACALLILASLAPSTPADDFAATLEVARRRGVDYLRGAATQVADQEPEHPGGLAAVMLYALRIAGEPPQDDVVRALASQAARAAAEERHLQSVVAAVLALGALDPHAHRIEIQDALARLQAAQRTGAEGAGAFGVRLPAPAAFPGDPASAPADDEPSAAGGPEWDHCSTALAVLALRIGLDLGVEVDRAVLARAARYLVDAQNRDGGFGYAAKLSPESSLGTTAGCLAALAMASEVLEPTGDQRRLRAEVQAALARGARRLESRLAFPPPDDAPYFAACAVERYAHYTGADELDGQDWFRIAARWVIASQAPDGSWGESVGFGGRAGRAVGAGAGGGKKSRSRRARPGSGSLARTSFALLFLSRASRTQDLTQGEPRLLLATLDPALDDRERIKERLVLRGPHSLARLIETLRVGDAERASFADECLRAISGRDMGFGRARDAAARREALDRWIRYYLEQRAAAGRRPG